MRRKEFLIQSGQAALGVLLFPFVGCVARKTQTMSAESKERALLGALIADLEEQIPKWMQDAKVPGLSIAVIKEAKLSWRRSFGVKDRSSQEPVDQDTIFEAASLSKPVFAYVVMKLCEKGVLDLDTPLTHYTQERFLEGDRRLDLITARHVLSHTTGFQDWRSEKEPLKIHFTPGERFLYSGEGYYYLQSVITHLIGHVNAKDCDPNLGLEVCATDFDPFMKANLLVPFGMHSSGYILDDSLARRLARPHDSGGKPMEKKSSRSSLPAISRYGSAGALLTTPTDYAKFVIEVLDPKPSDAFRLKREHVREMLRPHVKLEGGRYPASWALGWQIFRNRNRDFIYHGGHNDGFDCCAVASLEGKCGFVVMTNGDHGDQVQLNLLLADPMQQFLAGCGK